MPDCAQNARDAPGMREIAVAASGRPQLHLRVTVQLTGRGDQLERSQPMSSTYRRARHRPCGEGHDPVRDVVDGEPGAAVPLGRNPAFNTMPKINMPSPCPLIRPNRAKGRISGPRCHGLPKLSRSRPNRHGPFGQLKCGADVNRSVRLVVTAARIPEAQAA
jgi:hypothetical protein